MGTVNSGVEILSGKLTAELRGINIVAIGSVSGVADVNISGGDIYLENAGRNVVGIGSMNGTAKVTAVTDITVTCSGNRCCAIGTLDGGNGTVYLDNARFATTVNAKEASAIGAVGGDVDVTLNSGDYIIRCEGNDVTGVGDRTGKGDITINSGTMKLYTAASMELGIGTNGGSAVIAQLDANYEGRGKINAAAPDGSALDVVEVGENLYELHCKDI